VSRIYLDTAPVIYTVEQVSPYAAAVDMHLSASDIVVITSDLTRLECRVKPLREDDIQLLKDYDDFFNGSVAEIISLSIEVIDRATDIRAKYGFKTPDAIHLAAAVVSACDVFLTNDHRLDRFKEITLEILESNTIN
jgi:uncharacterized protein